MADALQSILIDMGLALAPFRAIKTPQQAGAFFQQLGYTLPSSAFGSGLNALAAQASGLVSTIEQLATASSDGDIASALVSLLSKLVDTVHSIEQLHTELLASAPATPNLADLPRRLTDFLLLDYLNYQRSYLHAALHVLGLIEHEPNPAPNRPTRTINWDRLTHVFNAPGQIAEAAYHWSSGFDANTFLARLAGVMKAATLPGGLYPQPNSTKVVLGNTTPGLTELRFPIFQKGFTPETYAQFGVTFSPADAQGSKGKGLALLPYILGAADFQFDVCDRGQLTFKSSADIKGVGVVLRPPFEVEGVLNAAGDFNASVLIAEKPRWRRRQSSSGPPGAPGWRCRGRGSPGSPRTPAESSTSARKSRFR